MKQYRVGLIGFGVISKYFVSAIEKNKSTKLYAVCTRSPLLFFPFESKGILKYRRYEDLISDNKVDVVIVATPNYTHYGIIKAALLADKHVVCEKPLTITVPEAKELISLAEKKKRLLFTVFHRRYNKQIIDLLRDENKRKKIRAIHARYLENIPDHSGNAYWYYDFRKSGGGCIIDNGINVIDVIRQMVGDIRLSHAHVGMRGKGLGRHDANAILTYDFKGGRATIELDWYYSGELKDFVIYFEDGIEYRDLLSGSVRFKESLWHEYEAAIADVVNRLEKHNYTPDIASIKALESVVSVYKKIYK
jgi:predicted dehydrogenase